MVNGSDQPWQPIPRRNSTRGDTGAKPDAGHGDPASRKPSTRNGSTRIRHSFSDSGHSGPSTGYGGAWYHSAGNHYPAEQHPAACNQSEFAEHNDSAGYNFTDAAARHGDAKYYCPASAVRQG